jgi:hypothetical protein
MKQLTIVLLCLFFTHLVTSQDLYVGSNSFIGLKSGASIAINGLQLTPSSDYTIASNTSVERKSTLATTGNVSIFRHYAVSPSLTNYTGKLVFNYKDTELNDAVEANLKMAMYGTDMKWKTYEATVATEQNTLTYNFTTAVDFSIVTADYNATLGVEELANNNQIVVYPNPTPDLVYINYPYPVNITLHNIVGKVLQKGTMQSVDLSVYKAATYFLTVENKENNRLQTFKIIKK